MLQSCSWKAANLTRITESILAAFIYENQFLSLKHVIILIAITFDSLKLEWICTPTLGYALKHYLIKIRIGTAWFHHRAPTSWFGLIPSLHCHSKMANKIKPQFSKPCNYHLGYLSSCIVFGDIFRHYTIWPISKSRGIFWVFTASAVLSVR